MSRNYLTIDMGTGNTKISIVNNKTGILDEISYENIYLKDNSYKDGKYVSLEQCLEKVNQSIKYLLDKHKDINIDAISAAGTRQSVVLFDKNHHPIIGLPNIDNRAQEYLGQIKEKEYIYGLTGRKVTEDFPAAKIFGYKQIYEQEFKDIKTFTSMSEWIGFEFTGKLVIEPSHACEMQFYDIRCKKFSKDILNLFCLENLEFPQIAKAGEKLGKVKDSWVLKYPQLKEAVFIVGGADTQIALENIENKNDSIMIVSGTTTPILAYSENPIYDQEKLGITNSDLRANNYLIEVSPGITGLNYQRFKDFLFEDKTYAELEKAYKNINQIKIIASLTSVKNIKNISKKTGVYLIKTPIEEVSSYDLAWSILADMACSIYAYISKLEYIMNKKYNTIRGLGNGLSSETLCQMIANLTCKNLILSPNYKKATTFGLANICNEYFENNKCRKLNKDSIIEYMPNNDELIKKYYKKWKANNIFI